MCHAQIKLSIRGHSYPRFTAARKKSGKLKKKRIHKFQNARQARTDRIVVKSISPNAPSTWLIFLCPRAHTSPQTWHHSVSSVLAVQISGSIITMFLFIKHLFTVIIVPKRKRSDAGSASKPKRRRGVLSSSEKVKILDIIEIDLKNRGNLLMRRRGDCQVVREERIFHSWSDEEQKTSHCSMVSSGLS
jgi:hypothetical protein